MNDVKKIEKTYKKWQTSLDLLVEYLSSSGALLLRTLPQRVEPVFHTFSRPIDLPSPSSFSETIGDMNLFTGLNEGVFSKRLSDIHFQSDLSEYLKGMGFSYTQGFSVEYGGGYFGVVFILYESQQEGNNKSLSYLSHYKSVFEDDLKGFFASQVSEREKLSGQWADSEEIHLSDQNWLNALSITALEGAYSETMDRLFSYLLSRSGADRIYTMSIDWALGVMGVDRESVREGVPSAGALRQNLSIYPMDWMINGLNRTHLVAVDSPSELPVEAAYCKKFMVDHGTEELLMAPLFVNGKMAAILGLDFLKGGSSGVKERSLLRSSSYIASLACEKEKNLSQLKEVESQLKESQISRSNLLATLNHEMQKPIESIVKYSEIMASEGQEALSDYRDLIKANRDDLYETISRIKDYTMTETKVVEIHGENIPVLSFLDDFHTSHRPVMPKNVELITRVHSPVDFSLYTDEHMVNQILDNFISNAIHFTEKGEIKIECRLRHDDHLIVFSVSDTGVGIPQDKQDVIFKRFTKLDPSAKGTGLGLTISQSLARALGGKIAVKSEVGKGSVFSLLLPTDHCKESA